jgi:hypothetical protein
MNSAKNLVLALLAVAVAGVGAFAWRQHRELVELRAVALNKDERAELQKRLWGAEKRTKTLEDQLAARRNSGVAEAGAPAGDGENTSPDGTFRRVRRGPGGPLNNIMSVMEKPEMQRLMALQQKAALDGRYAALFKSLNLSPEDLDKFKALLVEKQTAMQDVVAAARARGIDPLADPEGLRKMIADTQADVDNHIKAILGETGFAQYQEYQQTTPQRTLVSQLQQSLSYTSAPLSDEQAEQLVGILARTSPPSSRESATPAIATGMNVAVAFAPDGAGGGGGGATTFSIGENVMGFGGGLGGARITDEAIASAQSVLSPPQLQGLQLLQQQQQAQQQLQQTLRLSLGQTRTMERSQVIGGAPAAPATPTKNE